MARPKKTKKVGKPKGSLKSKRHKPKGRLTPKPQKPKQRGRPTGSRNTTINQFVRIRSLIWNQRRDKYKSYFDPELIDIARRVNDECKTAGTDCDDKVILHFHDAWSAGGKQYPIPVINPALFSPKPYWEIKSIADFAIESANVYFYSPMLIASPSGFRSLDYANYRDFQGKPRLSLERGYQNYFKEWVDWCNAYYRDNDITESDDIDVHFMLLPAVWDEEKGFWIVEIISCTADGRIGDFGFIPTGSGGQSIDDFQSPEGEPTKPSQEPVLEEPVTTEPKPKPSTVEDEIRADALKKEKTLERLLKVKDDAKNDYKFWKEMGDDDELKSAKARIKAITSQIDKLQS